MLVKSYGKTVDMDQARVYVLNNALTLTVMLLSLTLARSWNPGDCDKVIFVDKTSPGDIHAMAVPNPNLCNSRVRCTLTYRVKDEFMRLITKLCVPVPIHLSCSVNDVFSMRFIGLGGTKKIVEVNCFDYLDTASDYKEDKLCAPRGQDLEVISDGNYFCPTSVTDTITDFLQVHQQNAYSVVMKMTRSSRCSRNGRYRKTSEKNGAIISVYKPHNQGGLHICTVTVNLDYEAEKICLNFLEFLTYRSGAALFFAVKRASMKITTDVYHYNSDQEDAFCLSLDKDDREVLFMVVPGGLLERNNHHLFLFEYHVVSAKGSEPEDDDDDNDDLYWLFVIPGVAFLACCCYYCCKDDEEESGARDQPGEDSEVQTPPEALGIPNEHTRDRGEETIHLTLGAAEPSAPPLIVPPPPSFACSGNEPPPYHLLFPDQKH